jgi:hypothetical protein
VSPDESRLDRAWLAGALLAVATFAGIVDSRDTVANWRAGAPGS